MKVRTLGTAITLLGTIAAIAACSASSKRSSFGSDQDPTDPDGGADLGFGKVDTGAPIPPCDPAEDNGLEADCQTPSPSADECDTGLPLDPTDAMDAAKAMGLCRVADASKGSWGVIEAKWVKPDGTSLGSLQAGAGILAKFGVNAPQAGTTMLVLSSGTARAPSDPGYKSPSGDDKGYQSGTPQGYPKESPACPGNITGEAHDGIALEVKIKVPANANSFSYQQNFFTYEYPNFICSTFNDFFVTMMDPKPANLQDGNIAFDSDSNPISVNNSLLQACAKGSHGGKTFPCPLGTSTLAGTGFEQSAATGWLTTTAPVDPGSTITLRFAIWDSGDGILDSTVALDAFAFSSTKAEKPVTAPH